MPKKTNTLTKDQPLDVLLGRATANLKSALARAFAAKGARLTAEQWAVMDKLGQKQGVHQQDLADRTGKDRHTMARILHLMESRGLVERRFDKTDARRFNVFLSAEGKALRRKLAPTAKKVLAQALEGVAESKAESFKKTLAKVLANLDGARG